MTSAARCGAWRGLWPSAHRRVVGRPGISPPDEATVWLPLATVRLLASSISPLSPSLWYCSAPAKPNGVGVVPVRLTVMPNASWSHASVAVCPAFVIPRVLPSASGWRNRLTPERRSEAGE